MLSRKRLRKVVPAVRHCPRSCPRVQARPPASWALFGVPRASDADPRLVARPASERGPGSRIALGRIALGLGPDHRVALAPAELLLLVRSERGGVLALRSLQRWGGRARVVGLGGPRARRLDGGVVRPVLLTARA